jgi:hypothetical protein
MEKKIQVKLLGGKMKRGENDGSRFPFKNHQELEPFKDHQTLKPFKGQQVLEPFNDHQTLEPSINHQVKVFLHLIFPPSF